MKLPAAHSALRVVVLEDDAMLRDGILLPGLRRFGFDAEGLGTAAALERRVRAGTVDLAVVDVGLPDRDGFSIARDLHAHHHRIGVVMLTSRMETQDKVRGLSEGADAYLTKPVEIDLLAATLHSVSRRLGGEAPQPTIRDWALSADGWRLIAASGAAVALTASERKLCAKLFERRGLLVEREELIAALTDQVYEFDAHRLDSMIHRLRSKVLKRCGVPLSLSAVHGHGYILA
ncbi:response regulator transcription factor [Luteimonas huabeiensis]|uniref:response regulator transcription factor n=1 Tax=Luteimonas huabeiensis TaxID=1244513 RepID=UPI0004ACC669|nr:response regulator transcription factor [Luteimonas huabeiensis]